MPLRLSTWTDGDGDGPPVIVQGPAWGPSSHYLRATLVPLLDGFRVITFDPRNVGGSERVHAPDAQAVEHLVDDLEGLRRRLGFERFALVGHSHGGFVAMAYAVRHADRLSALVLLNTKVRRAGDDDCPDGRRGSSDGERSRAQDDEVEQILSELAENPGRRAAVAHFRVTLGNIRGVDTDAELAREMRRLMPAYFYDLEAMNRFATLARGAERPSAYALARVPEDLEPWVDEGLAEVRVPALVTTGRYDVVTTPSDARHIHRKLADSEIFVFERSGHHPWAEEPERFGEVVRGFLDRRGG